MAIEINRSYLKTITSGRKKYSNYWAMQIFFGANRSYIERFFSDVGILDIFSRYPL